MLVKYWNHKVCMENSALIELTLLLTKKSLNLERGI